MLASDDDAIRFWNPVWREFHAARMSIRKPIILNMLLSEKIDLLSFLAATFCFSIWERLFFAPVIRFLAVPAIPFMALPKPAKLFLANSIAAVLKENFP